MNSNTKRFKIVPLSEDVNQIVSRVGQGQFEMMRYCRDHSNPYLMDDKKPVFHDIEQDQLLCIFDFSYNHYFLTPEQLYRFGIFHKLNIYQILALMIKSEWEIFFLESLFKICDSRTEIKTKW